MQGYKYIVSSVVATSIVFADSRVIEPGGVYWLATEKETTPARGPLAMLLRVLEWGGWQEDIRRSESCLTEDSARETCARWVAERARQEYVRRQAQDHQSEGWEAELTPQELLRIARGSLPGSTAP